ncbi:MAG: hypothetical protein WC580_08020, partial [Agrococcus sp.]
LPGTTPGQGAPPVDPGRAGPRPVGPLPVGAGGGLSGELEPSSTATTLTLRAQVDNGDGGGAATTDWTLAAEGPTPIRGVTESSAITAALVEPGAYALSAAGGRAGYGAPLWSCQGGALDGSTVNVGQGDAVVCTATHDDDAVDLELTLDDGDAMAPNGGSFDMTVAVRNVGGRDVDLDEPVTVTASLPAGATLMDRGGCTADGPTVTCGIAPMLLVAGGTALIAMTVRFADDAPPGGYDTLAVVTTADDDPEAVSCESPSNSVDCERSELRYPTLTLVQGVTNDDGGEAALADFALSAQGPVGIAGTSGSPAVTGASVPAGAYRIAAAEIAGYVSGSWVCLGGELTGATLTISGITDVTCSIRADDQPVDLRLTTDRRDEVVGAGGEARFTLTVTNAGARSLDADERATVTAVLPSGLGFVTSGHPCSATGPTVTCIIAASALPAGASVAIEIVVAIPPGLATGTYRTAAAVTTEDDPGPAPGGCERPSNNIACPETAVGRGIVAAEKSVWEQVSGGWLTSDGAVGFGDLVQFRIVVRAGGDAPSTGVGIVDQLPRGLLADGAATCSVPCRAELDAETGTHRVAIGTMQPGAVVTVTIAARVPGVPSQADGTVVRVAFDSVAALSSDSLESASTNVVTVRASHALPPRGRTGGEIPIGGISLALALLVAGGLLLVRSRELSAR